jgi:hypothetical protein
VVSQAPLIYEFNGPIAATYPPSYDPSYWLEGLHLTFRPLRQATVLILNAQELLTALAGEGFLGARLSLSLVALLAVLLWMKDRGRYLQALPWEILVPALAGVGAYFIVLVLYRYVVAFLFVIVMGLFATALAGFDPAQTRAARGVVIALFVITYGVLLGQTLNGLRLDVRHLGMAQLSDNPYADAARDLHELGVAEGTPIADLGGLENAYFLQVARARVVSRVEDAPGFWNSPTAEQARIDQLLASTGAQAVVARLPAVMPLPAGWTPIGASGYVLHRLKTGD